MYGIHFEILRFIIRQSAVLSDDWVTGADLFGTEGSNGVGATHGVVRP